MRRIGELPAWKTLFIALGRQYGQCSSGGSKAIGEHCRFVTDAITHIIQADTPVRPPSVSDKPVTVHLHRALQGKSSPVHIPLLDDIERIHNLLEWRYGYEQLPSSLEKTYAYTQFCGPQGPVFCEDLILGLVLFAPGCVYPTHAHKGITESYICLSGSVSENNQGVYCAGSLIFNPSGKRHRITVSGDGPALLLYAWVGDPQKLAGPEMGFG